MINNIFRYLHLLTKSQKITIIVLTIMSLFLGILEVIGISLVIPLIGIILNVESDITINLPFGEVISNIVILLGITNFIFVIIGIFLLKSIYVVFFNYLKSKLQFNIQKKLSNFFFEKYVHSKWEYLLNNNSSKLTSYVLKEIEIFASLNSSVIQLIAEVIVLISILLLLSFFNLHAVLIVLIYALLFLIIYSLSTKKILLKYGKLRQETDIDRLNFVQEGLRGVKEVKIYRIEKYFINILKDLNNKYTRINVTEKTIAAIPYSLIEFTAICLIMSLILFFLNRGDNVSYLISLIGLFVAAFIRILPSFNRIIAVRHNLQYNFYVVNTLFDQYKTIQNFNYDSTINFKDIEDSEVLINVEELDFAYSSNKIKSKKIFEELNVKIKKNKSIGILGESGSGKTTFVDLLLGLHSPEKGKIVYNANHRLSKNKNEIKIGYVSQNIFLLNDSFLKNIAFGVKDNEIDIERVKHVAKFAEIDQLIDTYPNNYYELIGENGSRLSGGQKQRISIARSLYFDPDLIIFDEATNALDSLTEKKIIKNIYKISNFKTVIIISHNIENISECDYLYEITKKNIVQIR